MNIFINLLKYTLGLPIMILYTIVLIFGIILHASCSFQTHDIYNIIYEIKSVWEPIK